MPATVLFPQPIPPVSPTFSIRRSALLFYGWRIRTFGDGALPGISRSVAAHFASFHGVAHQHRDGERTDSAGHGSDCAGHLRGVGMNIARDGKTFFTEFRQAFRKICE